jgi:hypothetical protein
MKTHTFNCESIPGTADAAPDTKKEKYSKKFMQKRYTKRKNRDRTSWVSTHETKGEKTQNKKARDAKDEKKFMFEITQPRRKE